MSEVRGLLETAATRLEERALHHDACRECCEYRAVAALLRAVLDDLDIIDSTTITAAVAVAQAIQGGTE